MARASGLQTSLVIHAVVYAIVVGGLVMMNQDVGHGRWSLYVAWGWGIGLAAHTAVWALYGRRSSR